MSADPIKKRFIWAQLVDQATEIEGIFKTSNSSRLVDALAVDEISVEAPADIAVRLSFGRDKRGRPAVTGCCHWQMEVCCVSCDRPLIQDLHTAFSLVIVGHEDDLARLNQDEDGVVADGKWVHLMDIIEDPILLAVPMAPRHPDCSDGTIIRGAAAANALAEEGSESEGRMTDFTPHSEPAGELEETRKPFANLRALMESGRTGETS